MNKKLRNIIVIMLFLLLATSCIRRTEEPTPTPLPPARETPTPATINTPTAIQNNPALAYNTDFENGDDDFLSGFLFYPISEESDYQLKSGVQNIEELLSKGYYLSGNNVSDRLLMYITKGIQVLPNNIYIIKINFDIVTSAPQDSYGQTVFVKVGANNIPFIPAIDNANILQSNWDIGDVGGDGSQAATLGTIEKITSADESNQYKNFSRQLYVTANEDGIIYLVFSIETSNQGKIETYFDNIVIELTQGS